MIPRLIKNPTGIVSRCTSTSWSAAANQLTARTCSRRLNSSQSLSEARQGLAGRINYQKARPIFFNQHHYGITSRLSACTVQTARYSSTAADQSNDEKTETTRDDFGSEIDSEAVKNDAQIEKDLKEEQDLWLKLCSNKDPNDNTVSPETFNDTDPWKTQEESVSSDEYSSNQ